MPPMEDFQQSHFAQFPSQLATRDESLANWPICALENTVTAINQESEISWLTDSSRRIDSIWCKIVNNDCYSISGFLAFWLFSCSVARLVWLLGSPEELYNSYQLPAIRPVSDPLVARFESKCIPEVAMLFAGAG